jgi:uncharacterized RDD family membrane protein YckC
MRCPKCHYLSFEPEPRCRNCGYDLAVPEADLLIKPADETDGPLADLSLKEPVRAPSRRPPTTLGLIRPARSNEPERPSGATMAAAATIPSPRQTAVATPAVAHAADVPAPQGEALASFVSETPAPRSPIGRPEPGRAPHSTGELPLFVKAMPQEPSSTVIGRIEADEPLVKVPPAPRAPLGVRRSSPEPPKARSTNESSSRSARKLGPFDRDLLDDLRRVEKEEARQARADARIEAAPAGADGVGVGRRLLAAFIDLILLAAITGGAAWATFRVTGIQPTAVGAAVIAPLAAFLLLLDLGYLIMFTAAGGQTVGKMAAGIRVIGTSDDRTVDERLTFKRAVYRELLTLPLLLPLGAGLLPALFGQGLAVHDRLAHTRVVRA